MRSLAAKRQFSHIKFQLLLIFLLNLYDALERKEMLCVENFAKDMRYFPTQSEYCAQIVNTLQYDDAFWLRNKIFQQPQLGFRQIQILQLKNVNTRIIAKYPKVAHNLLEQLETPLNVQQLRKIFFSSERLGNFQLCSAVGIQRFVELLANFNACNESTIWLHMLVNVQPILLPYLEAHDFPVPKTYATCGFTLLQQHVGATLTSYCNANFIIKVQIAKQLLEAALKFTYGFAQFRVYLTDLTADNLVYNEQENKLYFIDLDTVFIVNANATVAPMEIHRQIYRKCANCFAYEPAQFCRCGLSDVNLLSACAFLRDDTKQQRLRGFLYPIPAEITTVYANLTTLLDGCVGKMEDAYTKEGSTTRFVAIVELIEILKRILTNIYSINCDLTK